MSDGESGEVVRGGAKSADREYNISAAEGELDRFNNPGEVIAYGLTMGVGDALAGEKFSEGCGVGIGDLSEEELGSYGDDFRPHVTGEVTRRRSGFVG